MRFKVQERRTGLKNARAKVSQADDQFISYVRSSRLTGSGLDNVELDNLYEECRKTRDDVGPLEDEYEKLELKLDNMEFAFAENWKQLNLGETISSVAIDAEKSAIEDESDVEDENTFYESSSSGNGSPHDPREASALHGHLLGYAVSVGQHPAAFAASHAQATETDHSAYYNFPTDQQSYTIGEERNSYWMEEDKHDINDIAPDLMPSQYGPSPWSSTVTRSDTVDIFTNEEFQNDPTLYSLSNEIIPDTETAKLVRSFSGDFPQYESTLLSRRKALNEHLINFESALHRVDQWLLHRLRDSPFEVLLYQHSRQKWYNSWPILATLPDDDVKHWEYENKLLTYQAIITLNRNPLPPRPSSTDFGGGRRRKLVEKHERRKLPPNSLSISSSEQGSCHSLI
jgi:hypothetical protein